MKNEKMTLKGFYKGFLAPAILCAMPLGYHVAREIPIVMADSVIRKLEEQKDNNLYISISNPKLEEKINVSNVRENYEKLEKKSEDRIEDYIRAIFIIESGNNPRAERFERHLGESSYGLGQLLESTARELERNNPELPRLGKTRDELRKNLFNPEINRAYTKAHFSSLMNIYDNNAELAVAAYNSGTYAPRNAFIQQQLNDIYNAGLTTDGIIGAKTREFLKRFQRENGLNPNGRINSETIKILREVYFKEFPNRENRDGIVPNNKYTPNHVEKFKKALKSIKRN